MPSAKSKTEKMCKVCGKTMFLLPWEIAANKTYCSNACRIKSTIGSVSKYRNSFSNFWGGGKVEVTCNYCGVIFFAFKSENRKYCSAICANSVAVKGSNNPNWNGGKVEKVCQCCGNTYFVKKSKLETSKFCSTTCTYKGANYSKGKSHYHWGNGQNIEGEKNGRWQGGKSFEPYPPTFNERFKRMIRERDNYTCVVCNGYGKEVHHINYVKNDTVPDNCITLCKSCHSKTNSNREYWIEYFKLSRV